MYFFKCLDLKQKPPSPYSHKHKEQVISQKKKTSLHKKIKEKKRKKKKKPFRLYHETKLILICRIYLLTT